MINDVQAEPLDKEGYTKHWKVITTSIVPEPLDEDPRDEPCDIELVESDQFQSWSYFDREGKAILNAAGDLYPMPIEDSRLVFKCSKNMRQLPIWIPDFKNAINQGMIIVLGIPCPKETLMCKNQTAKKAFATVNKQKIEYFKYSFELHLKPEGWKATAPNVGFNERGVELVPIMKKGANGTKIPDKDAKGNVKKEYKEIRKRILVAGSPCTEPMPLDRYGYFIEKPEAKDIIKIEADMQKVRNFGTLPLN